MTHLAQKLCAAIINEDLDLVKELVTAGANVNARSQNGVTPLMLAVRAPNYKSELTNYLLDHGADVFATDNQGRTAKDYIVLPPAPPEHHENAYEAWIYCEEHYLVNRLYNHKVELFFQAVQHGDLEQMKSMARQGLAVDRLVLYGQTPLMQAMSAAQAKLDIVRYLLDQGVDIQATDYKGKTALDHLRSEREQAAGDPGSADHSGPNQDGLVEQLLLLHLPDTAAQSD